MYGDRVHVYRLHDVREHIIDEVEPCWCDPILTEDGVVVHNSVDEKEKYETGERKYN